MNRLSLIAAVVCLFSVITLAQQAGIIKGSVTDDSGAVIPGASITLVISNGEPVTVSTNENGQYSIAGVGPGRHTVRVNAAGFGTLEKELDMPPGGTVTFDAPLRVTLAKQEVTVEAENRAAVTIDPTQNAGAIVLKAQELEALSDDPDALAADLQALAGPSAGPNGGQIYIDGFSNARLPPKESIREVRINQNPFSAEYDRLGFGRIEIFTKPGTDKFHGQAMFNFSDDTLNSRNPFISTRAPYQSRMSGANFGGPLTKKSSFFFDFEKRDIDDNAIINATVLNDFLQPERIAQAVLTPNRRTSFTPRLDYALSPNHTIVARYHFTSTEASNTGIGDLSLLSRAYSQGMTDHTFQITETSVLGPTMINETRLQYIRRATNLTGENADPSLNVLGSFQGGGAQVGNATTKDNRWELTNITSVAKGAHAVKLGGRFRFSDYSSLSPRNFGGTYTFAAGLAPVLGADNQVILDAAGNALTAELTSLERYQRTLFLIQHGFSGAQLQELGAGPTQFSIAGGNPLAGVSQFDGAIFVQDDWRFRSNLTLSLGLRYEGQTNVRDWTNFAPRIGIAWAPGSRGGRTGKTVIRGGFGTFYDRVEQDLILDTLRFNGYNQLQYVVRKPSFYPLIPSVTELGSASPQTIQTMARNLRVPYMMQAAIGVERQLPFNTTLAVTFTNTRAIHLLRSSNLRAVDPSLGENVYQYESTGMLNQRQLMFNVNSRLTRQISIFSFYVLNNAKSDTDGAGTFPANPLDYSLDYGRANIDIRHRFMLGGSIAAPRKLRLSPFITARSGSPYNITTGTDLNGDNVFTDRPSLVDSSAPFVLARSSFNLNPAAGQTIIPRNFAEGPGFFAVNLRISRTWGFGGTRGARSDATVGGGNFGGGPGGPRGGGGGMRGGGGGGIRMGGGGGMRGGFDGTTEQRFNLTLMVAGRNIFNTVNAAAPIGNLGSPLFGQSTQLAGGFGPGSDANNRRIDVGLRFTF